MIRLAAGENFNGIIVRGPLRRNPSLDILRVQDTEISEADDPTVLEWAARQGRVLITHDVNTIPRFVYERIRARQPMPGVFEVSDSMPVGQAIEDLLLLAEGSEEGEWEGQILYIPL